MKYPTSENNILVLANNIINGLTVHPLDFPNIDAITLGSAQGEYLTASNNVEITNAAYRQAITTKNEKLANLSKTIKTDLRQAEVDCVDAPDNLYEIGWAPKSPATPLAAPGQVELFIAVTQGPGDITFKWNKPLSGGKVTNYIVQRRSEDNAGGFYEWQQVYTSFETDCQLAGQPRSEQLEYRVIASNPAGEAEPSNIASAVL